MCSLLLLMIMLLLTQFHVKSFLLSKSFCRSSLCHKPSINMILESIKSNSLLWVPSKLSSYASLRIPQIPLKSNETFSHEVSDAVATFEGGVKKDLNSLKVRVDSIEKSISSLLQQQNSLSSTKSKTVVGSFVESITATTIEINPKSVEICAVISFFFIGSILGASLLDRLWLIGGIIGSIWASGAVYRDTRGGLLARKIGVQLAQTIKDIQEKYNQFVIFYRTGKLAYMSARIWDKYDEEYKIQQRVDVWKKIVMNRAIEFNTAFQQYQLPDQLKDMWSVLLATPTKAKKLNEEYGLTNSILNFGKGVYSAIGNSISSITSNEATDRENYNSKDDYVNPIFDFLTKTKSDTIQFLKKTINKRESKKNRINVWGTPFHSYKSDGYRAYVKRYHKKKRNQNSENIWTDLWSIFR